MTTTSDEKPRYVKSFLTKELDTALEIVSKKLGNSRSSIVNAALGYYFKNQHPEALPKTDLEILEEARQNYLQREVDRKYSSGQVGVDFIPIYEEEIEKWSAEIRQQKQRRQMLESSLSKTKNQAKQKEIENQIINIKHAISNKESLINMNKMHIENSKKGIEL